jgi:hypothetical protein
LEEKMKANGLILGLFIAGSSLFALQPAKAEYVDDGYRNVYTNVGSNWHDNDDRYDRRNGREECRKERRVVYEYDHDGYRREVVKKVRYCYYVQKTHYRHSRYNHIQSIPFGLIDRGYDRNDYHSNRHWDGYNNRKGGINIRLGF